MPGQATLAPRRRRLLLSADAIVFVGDSSPIGFAADRGYLAGLFRVLEQLPQPPVGVVLQANKRDHAQAVPIERIRAMLDDMRMRMGVVESVASGMVWPPVDGRTVLQELTQARVQLDRSADGDWSGAANGRYRLWRITRLA